MLSMQSISKKYGKLYALKDVELEIKKGEMVALIGNNGSGKTTLMKIISGITKASTGTFEWETNRQTNLIETPEFFDYLSGYKNLEYFRIQRGIQEQHIIEDILERVGLPNDRKKFKQYSLGMKQRLAIGLCLLGNPEFMVLDEPTNGVDAQGIIDIRNLLLTLNKEEQLTMLISSHNINELYNIATRFVFIKSGEIKKDISKSELNENIGTFYQVNIDRIQDIETLINDKVLQSNYYILDDKNTLKLVKNSETSQFIEQLSQKGLIDDISEVQVMLEDYYLEIMKG